MSGFNPDFGMIEYIYSHCAELFGVLTIFLFLQDYYTYIFIKLTYLIEFYCDNEEVIHKLTQLTTDINYFDAKYKTTNFYAVMKLK